MSRNIVVHKKAMLWVSGCFALAIAILIFCFSSQPASVSGPLSEQITYRILKFLLFFLKLTEQRLSVLAEEFNVFIRKAAHFSLYAALGISFYVFISCLCENKKTTLILSGIFPLMYAISDEIHQYFVPGRSAEIRDVFIDFSGIVVGIVFFICLKTIIRKFKKV